MKSALIFSSVFVFQTREYTRFNCDPRNWARSNLTCRRNRPSAIRQRAKTVQKYFSSVSRRLQNRKSYHEMVFFKFFFLLSIRVISYKFINQIDIESKLLVTLILKNFELTLDRLKYKSKWPLSNNLFPSLDRCLHVDETGWQCYSFLNT